MQPGCAGSNCGPRRAMPGMCRQAKIDSILLGSESNFFVNREGLSSVRRGPLALVSITMAMRHECVLFLRVPFSACFKKQAWGAPHDPACGSQKMGAASLAASPSSMRAAAPRREQRCYPPTEVAMASCGRLHVGRVELAFPAKRFFFFFVLACCSVPRI